MENYAVGSKCLYIHNNYISECSTDVDSTIDVDPVSLYTDSNKKLTSIGCRFEKNCFDVDMTIAYRPKFSDAESTSIRQNEHVTDETGVFRHRFDIDLIKLVDRATTVFEAEQLILRKTENDATIVVPIDTLMKQQLGTVEKFVQQNAALPATYSVQPSATLHKLHWQQNQMLISASR